MDKQAPEMLEALGLDEVEERIYLALLRGPSAATDLASRLTLQRVSAGRALGRLEEKGLVSRAPGRGGRYRVLSPRGALEVLLLQRSEQLQHIRLLLPELEQEFESAYGADRPWLVDVLSGRQAVGRAFVQMQQTVTEEMLLLDRPPYSISPHQNEPGFDLLERGVEARVVYDTTSLAIPNRLELRRRAAAMGEKQRVYDGLPVKLAIADRKWALIPLAVDQADMERGALIVRESALLDALTLLFDLIWQRGSPLPEAADRGEAPERAADRELLALLSAGVKDETIARHLGVTQRTIERRVRRLMESLDATTRFQLGAFATSAGLITPGRPVADGA